MTLPKLSLPTYTTKLPSNGQDVKFRPLLVKDDKAIAIANQEQGDPRVLIDTIKNIVDNCTFNSLDMKSLPFFDVEWLFIQIRNKSASTELELSHTCESCGTKNPFKIDLSQVSVSEVNRDSLKIMLDDRVGIKMKYPSFDVVREIFDMQQNDSAAISYMSSFVECIFDGDNIHTEFTKEEFSDFIGEMNSQQFDKLSAFFEKMPTIELDISIKCPKCETEIKEHVRGLQNFLV